MGMFKKRVKVSNSKKPEMFFEEEFWIDTGAMYSFVPEDYLERLVDPIQKKLRPVLAVIGGFLASS
jgi:hypothetical protein